MKSEYAEIPAKDIVTETRLRRNPGDLATLENSIGKFGMLCPLIVDRNNVLIAGARRFEACRRLGLEQVRAIRVDAEFDSMEALDIQTDENLCRQPLSEEELNRHIQMKKDLAEGRTLDGRPRSFLGRLKALLCPTPAR